MGMLTDFVFDCEYDLVIINQYLYLFMLVQESIFRRLFNPFLDRFSRLGGLLDLGRVFYSLFGILKRERPLSQKDINFKFVRDLTVHSLFPRRNVVFTFGMIAAVLEFTIDSCQIAAKIRRTKRPQRRYLFALGVNARFNMSCGRAFPRSPAVSRLHSVLTWDDAERFKKEILEVDDDELNQFCASHNGVYFEMLFTSCSLVELSDIFRRLNKRNREKVIGDVMRCMLDAETIKVFIDAMPDKIIDLSSIELSPFRDYKTLGQIILSSNKEIRLNPHDGPSLKVMIYCQKSLFLQGTLAKSGKRRSFKVGPITLLGARQQTTLYRFFGACPSEKEPNVMVRNNEIADLNVIQHGIFAYLE